MATLPKHYLYINEFGLPEARDVDTGEVIKLQVTPAELSNYRLIRDSGKIRWVPLAELDMPKKYSPLIADMICQGLFDGVGINKAVEDAGLTYREYCGWRRAYPEFADMVDEARKDRAEVLMDKLERVAEETPAEEDEIALGRLKAEVYKHVAEVSNPGRFSKKTTVQGSIGIGVIHVDTGIRRPGDEGHVEVTFREIDEVQKKIAEGDASVVPVVAHKVIDSEGV